jgi:hypothetical protein
MANPIIDIFIKVDDDKIMTNEKLVVSVHASVKGVNIAGIAISGSINVGGTLTPATGVTDQYGNFQTVFKPSTITADTFFTLTFSASKTGLTSSSKTLEVYVEILPDDLKTGSLEHSIMLYRIRDMILKAVRKTLDNDRELYPNIGLTSAPVYYNGWNYSAKEFPQIIISGSSLSPRETGLGNHMIGEGREILYGTFFQDYEMLGGWFDLTLSLSCVAESKAVQEKLLSNAVYALWVQQRSNLNRDNVLILSIDAGNEVVEPYQGVNIRYLYGGSVNIKLATEWYYKNVYDRTISEIDITQTAN